GGAGRGEGGGLVEDRQHQRVRRVHGDAGVPGQQLLGRTRTERPGESIPTFLARHLGSPYFCPEAPYFKLHAPSNSLGAPASRRLFFFPLPPGRRGRQRSQGCGAVVALMLVSAGRGSSTHVGRRASKANGRAPSAGGVVRRRWRTPSRPLPEL